MRADCLNDGEPRAHRTFRMRLICIRPAEIGEDAVTNEPGDVALLSGYSRSNACLIFRQNLSQIFRIKTSR